MFWFAYHLVLFVYILQGGCCPCCATPWTYGTNCAPPLRRMGSASFLDCHVEGLSWQIGDLAIPPRLSKNMVSESPNFGREDLTNQSFKLLWPLSPVEELSLLCLLRLGYLSSQFPVLERFFVFVQAFAVIHL
jgi:hypothetical protein